MSVFQKSIYVVPSEMTLPAVTWAMLSGFAGLDKFGRWRPSIKGYGPRPTEEERAAALAEFDSIFVKAVSIFNRWYMVPIVYVCLFVIRPVCLLLVAVRDWKAKSRRNTPA